MKFLRFFCLLPALVVLLATCKVANSPTEAVIDIPVTYITTTVAGAVVDESNQPIAGAQVTIYGKSTITDQYGTFMIQNISVPENRCFILCKKNGYFTGSRAEVPKSSGITELRLTMQSSAPGYTVNSSTGGTVSIGTAFVKFPPSAFVTSDGSPFTGTVKVAAKHLDPSQLSFYNSFSGDMTARRTDGTLTELLSYGVIRVRLTDDAGNELKLAAGKTATLTYPIAQSQQKTAPASMPLWYFDEALGMWKEEGVAVKSGNNYTGEVAHFTDWNLDDPTLTGIINGRVVCDNEGVAGVYVRIGQQGIITDKDGYYTRRVPLNIDLTISVRAAENAGLSANDLVVSAIRVGEVRTQNISLQTCPSYITGTLINCNGSPVAGTIVVNYLNGYTYHFTTTGTFKMRVPNGSNLSVEATTFDGKIVSPRSLGTLELGENHDLGLLSSCESGNTGEVMDITLGAGSIASTLFSNDGALLAITGNRKSTGNFVEVYDAKTGKIVSQFKDENAVRAVNFSDDGTKLLIEWFTKSMATVVNPRTGDVLQTFDSAYRARLLPNGTEVIIENFANDYRHSLYSVATGLKIKKLSFSQMASLWKLTGTRGSQQFIMLELVSSQTRIIDWDIATDKKAKEITIKGSAINFGTGYSPDYTVISVADGATRDPNGSYGDAIYYYNTVSGAKINAKGYLKNDNDAIGIANDETFIRQRNDTSASYIPPTIYTISDEKPLKILAIPAAKARYRMFNYSSNSQYAVGVQAFPLAEPPMVVRIWKVK